MGISILVDGLITDWNLPANDIIKPLCHKNSPPITKNKIVPKKSPVLIMGLFILPDESLITKIKNIARTTNVDHSLKKAYPRFGI